MCSQAQAAGDDAGCSSTLRGSGGGAFRWGVATRCPKEMCCGGSVCVVCVGLMLKIVEGSKASWP